METSRTAVIVGGNRIPFAKIGTTYATASEQEMLQVTLDGLVARFGLKQYRQICRVDFLPAGDFAGVDILVIEQVLIALACRAGDDRQGALLHAAALEGFPKLPVFPDVQFVGQNEGR